MQNDAPDPNNPRRDVLICLALAFITLALYWPVSHFEFNNYDDAQYITKNPVVQAGLRAETISWAFTSGYAGNWHPLTWLSHMLDVELYGLNPGGHHLTNLLFHIANTLLLFGLLRRLTGMVWRAAFVAALFAWHPMHVESVAWVAERKDVLSAFFALLTLWAYAKYAVHSKPETRNSKLFYCLALLCFALGLLAKPMLVSLPLLMLLLDYWPLNRISNLKAGEKRKSSVRLLLEKIPFFALSLVSCYVTFRVQKSGGAMSITNLSFGDRAANAVNSYVGYITKMFWPRDLCILYPYNHHLPAGQIIAAGVILLLISIVVLACLRTRPWLAVGWFWFLIMLIPVIGLVQVGEQAMADRYSYLPYIGLFILIAWEIPRLLAAWPAAKPALRAAAALALVGCLAVASLQLRYWRNSVTLFSRAVEVTTGNYIAHGNLGEAWAALGQTDKALAEFDQALRIRPDYLQALNNQGSLFTSLGRFDDAIALFNQALALRPDWYLAHRNLGLAFLKQGRLDDAVVQFRAAIRGNPADDQAFTNLGLALAQEGKLDDAIAQYHRALEIAPNPFAENALGGALENQDKLDEAAAHYLAAATLKPDFAEAQNNLGAVLNAQRKFPAARERLLVALKLSPDSAPVHCNLGNALFGAGEFSDAAAQYAEAIRLQPDNLEARLNLASLLARDRQWDAAAGHYTEILRLKPEFSQARLGLASVLVQSGKDREAVEQYRVLLRANPKEPVALRRLAWILATDSEATLRDGAEALRLSTIATQQATTDASAWDIHAAACAEAGHFADAVSAAKKALELANNQKELAAQIQARLQLYESNQPYHQTNVPAGK